MPKQSFVPEVINTIYVNLSKGNYLKSSAEAAGVSYRSVLGWMKKGKEDATPEHAEFYQNVKRITAEWEVKAVDSINKYGGAKLQLEMLSRKNPEQWAATTRAVKIANQRIEEFMDYLISELSDDPQVMERVLNIAKNFTTEDDIDS